MSAAQASKVRYRPVAALGCTGLGDGNAAIADSEGRHANVRYALTSGRMLKPSRPP